MCCPALLRREFPVFVREGAVIPLKVTRAYTEFGDTNSAGFTTWLVYPDGKSQFTLWHPESHPKQEKTTLRVYSGSSLKLEFSGNIVQAGSRARDEVIDRIEIGIRPEFQFGLRP